jgi:hypothetical protein
MEDRYVGEEGKLRRKTRWISREVRFIEGKIKP